MSLLKHTLLTTTLLALVTLGGFLAMPQAVGAASQLGDDFGRDYGTDADPNTGINCKADSWADLDTSNCGILNVIVVFTNILAAAAGVIIVGSLVFAGIQYSAAAADGNKIQAAKKRIYDALLALMFLVFGYSFIQWLVPGGIF